MTAAVGRQQPYAGDLPQSLPELVPEMAGVAGIARLSGRLPDVGAALLPQRLLPKDADPWEENFHQDAHHIE